LSGAACGVTFRVETQTQFEVALRLSEPAIGRLDGRKARGFVKPTREAVVVMNDEADLGQCVRTGVVDASPEQGLAEPLAANGWRDPHGVDPGAWCWFILGDAGGEADRFVVFEGEEGGAAWIAAGCFGAAAPFGFVEACLALEGTAECVRIFAEAAQAEIAQRPPIVGRRSANAARSFGSVVHTTCSVGVRVCLTSVRCCSKP